MRSLKGTLTPASRASSSDGGAHRPRLSRRPQGATGRKIAVGVDVLGGFVAIRGWTEVTETKCLDFMQKLAALGVKTVICTDISKDGVLGGANHALYRELNDTLPLDIIASGGVAALEDVAALTRLGLYGTILGKSLYTGSIDLRAALQLVRRIEEGEA